jgi:hypothetical protein
MIVSSDLSSPARLPDCEIRDCREHEHNESGSILSGRPRPCFNAICTTILRCRSPNTFRVGLSDRCGVIHSIDALWPRFCSVTTLVMRGTFLTGVKVTCWLKSLDPFQRQPLMSLLLKKHFRGNSCRTTNTNTASGRRYCDTGQY